MAARSAALSRNFIFPFRPIFQEGKYPTQHWVPLAATLAPEGCGIFNARKTTTSENQGDFMKRFTLALASAALPTALGAQTQAPTQARPAGPAPDYNAGGLPSTPSYGSVEGKPIDARTPEKKADTRQFPQQTRAPFHHASDFKVTVVTDKLQAAWASALLPDGKLLVT